MGKTLQRIGPSTSAKWTAMLQPPPVRCVGLAGAGGGVPQLGNVPINYVRHAEQSATQGPGPG